MGEENVAVEKQQKPIKIWRRKYIHLVNEENDIKFRGPLSYRYLRILGWICLFISQVGMLLNMGANANMISVNGTFLNVLSIFKDLMTPLFLFAAFAQVLVAKDGYKRLLRTYTLGALGLYLGFVFVFLYFGASLFTALSGDWSSGYSAFETLIYGLNSHGSLSFNIFIDLLLCTLVTLFLNYHPKEHFKGNKIYIFRSLVAIPLLYEAASIALKITASAGLIAIPPFVIPLLTTKPPVAFFIFVVLALFVKGRERYYVKHGKTHEEYKQFLNTNVNRLHFSLFLVSTVIGAVIVDIFLLFLIFAFKLSAIPNLEALTKEEAIIVIQYCFQSTYELGFGKCVPMILIIPVLIFFDYTKTHKDKIGDILVPAAGIGALLLLYMFGLFELLKAYLASLGDKLKQTDSTGEEPVTAAIKYIKDIFKK